MPEQLLDPSGGLGYHWRALRYRHTLWRPFAAQVAHWLADWQPPQRELVLIGPSAGYTLNAEFLGRFRQIAVLEPDPLARWLLRKRFPSAPFSFDTLDCFAGLHGPLALRQQFPHAAFLFCNVIGQQLAGLDARWPASLQQALRDSSWASYHDVMASERAPRQTQMRPMKNGETLEEVLSGFWSGGEVLEIFDHGSFAALPAQAHAIWSITPQQHHLVAWTSISVDGSSTSMLPNTGIGGRS